MSNANLEDKLSDISNYELLEMVAERQGLYQQNTIGLL